MTFPLDKILTMSAKDYVGSSDVRDSYDVKGVHFNGLYSNDNIRSVEMSLDIFAKKVPKNAEIITDLKRIVSNSIGDGKIDPHKKLFIQISGTALIPKNK